MLGIYLKDTVEKPKNKYHESIAKCWCVTGFIMLDKITSM